MLKGTTTTAALALMLSCHLAGFNPRLASHAPQAGAPQPLPAFDAASVKPFTFTPAVRCQGLPQTDPQHLTVCANLEVIISEAYGLDDFQISGLPGWATKQLNYISATTAEPTTRDRMLLMLRRLLVVRFGLRLAAETRMTPVLALTVAPGGPKFQALAVGENPQPPPPPAGQHHMGVCATLACFVFFLTGRVPGRFSDASWWTRPV